MNKRDKEIIFTFMVLILMLLVVGVALFFISVTPEILDISVSNEISEDFTKEIKVSIKNPINQEIQCAIEEKENVDDNTKWETPKNNICEFSVKAGSYYIFLKNKYGNITNAKTNNIEINKILDLEVNTPKVYLTFGETYKIKANITSIGTVNEKINYISKDESIITVNDEGIITPVSFGEADIEVSTENNITKTIKVIVTGLYKKASLENNNIKLGCGYYNAEQEKILDEVLAFKVNEAGYQTRGGVIAAFRFLILEFPYRISYYFENGRLNNTDGQKYVDGEGRYYKKGLYLTENKFSDIVASFAGPVTWGCPITNYNDEYGYVIGEKYPNGLDCSGFVSWALYNGGFDIGDKGAGDTPRDDDLSDLGERVAVTRDFIYNGNYKVGDLIWWDGHMAFIAGITDTDIYVAESLIGGAVIKRFSKDDPYFYYLYNFINLMDDIYKEDGIYSDMW